MATPGFGFSVGDVLAGLHVVRKLIRALNDTAGSRPAYRSLISELLNLQEALTSVNNLQVDPAQAAQKLALDQVAQECQGSIERFLSKNAKFENSLGVRPSSLSAWRSCLHKVQWALCKESEIEGLRTEIAAHSTTLNLILSTIQLSATNLQSQAIDGCAQLAKVARVDNDETKALAEKNNQLLATQADLLVKVSSTVANLPTQHQNTELQSLVQKVLESNMRIFNTVIQIQQLHASLPPQVDRQQPILFQDAHERLTPFHVEFINSFAAFQAVLEVRFSQVPGLKKVIGLEYAMEDTASKRTLDLTKPWESIFRPGRKVVMSMLFQQVESTISSCPGCLKETVQEDSGEDTHTQCSNPTCGLWFRRVTEVRSIKRSLAEQQDRGAMKRRRMGLQSLHNDDQEDNSDDEDDIRDFRRVQIVQEKRAKISVSVPKNPMELPVVPSPSPRADDLRAAQTQELRDGYAGTDMPPEPDASLRPPEQERTPKDVISDQLYDPPRRRRIIGHMWECCKCHGYWNKSTTPACLNCGHERWKCDSLDPIYETIGDVQ
ncbi:hypothetical protein N0V82_007913 [Gnomoniopsis sp. IMI 355080]|nr:hypothetical protein N0V82_007913 [Gnomoniopsis sp. IMI 355080]